MRQFNVIETFSGIGSQAKALKRVIEEKNMREGTDWKLNIKGTADWDMNAIIAYDLIHHGTQDLTGYEQYSAEELDIELSKFSLSANGKELMSANAVKVLSLDVKKRLLCAIRRSKNFVSITDIKGEQIPDNLDLLTYSFPCQDLSICGFWHGNTSGIDREAKNRSGMLWEVERILQEMSDLNKKLPKFLLMENVSNILSKTHAKDFNEWKQFLATLGYENIPYKLNAKDFGIPQKRQRVYMLSVLVDINKKSSQYMELRNYLGDNDLSNAQISDKFKTRNMSLKDILKIDYEASTHYREEANYSQPNDTPSRRKIFEKNDKLFDGKDIKELPVNTITTKQDRHPNSGVIVYDSGREGKAEYRNLTPRECFLLMGFDEEDYQILVENNPNTNKSRKLFSREKLVKMAGNSIVVDVLEAIFKQMIEIDEIIG